MRVLVAGATGVVGQPLVRRLRAAGHEPVALSRRPVDGVETVLADVVLDELQPAVRDAGCDALVVQLTVLPDRFGPGARRGFPANDRMRRDGVPRLLQAAREGGIGRLVVQSMIALAGVTEGPRTVRAAAAALAAMERAAADAVVLRYALLAGPGTWCADDGAYAALARRRALPLSGRPMASYLHVEDAAAAAVVALDALPGRYDVTDGQPVDALTFWTAYAAWLGAPPPRTLPRWVLRTVAGGYAAWFATTPAIGSGAPALPQWSPSRTWRDAFTR